MGTTDGGTGLQPVQRRLRACTTKCCGSALLTVLWLSAALSAIAFSIATTVRGETERTSTAVDGLRSYYLATGGIQRAILHMLWARQVADVAARYYTAATPLLRFTFSTGEVQVEIIPEAAKWNINRAA